jgi:hypothetical protein
MFLSVLRHLKIQKPTSQQGRKTNEKIKKNPCISFRTVFDNQNITYQ